MRLTVYTDYSLRMLMRLAVKDDGLATIAEEIARLTEDASRAERMRVETHGRYLDARYKDGLSDS